MSKGEQISQRPNGHVPVGKQPHESRPAAHPSPSANRPQRRNSAKQLYRRYVNKSNLFAQSSNGTTQNGGAGRWQIGGTGSNGFRMSDSMPSANQLEWQKQRRAQTRQLAMNASGSLNGPKIVQKHAEMRAYLLHCQRVLTARPVVDTGRPNAGRSVASSSITSSPSVDGPGGSWAGAGRAAGKKEGRTRSVPANARGRRETTEFERELQEENRLLLERLVRISTRPSPSSPSSSQQFQSRQSTGNSGSHRRAPSAGRRASSTAKARKEEEEEEEEVGSDEL